MVMASSWNKGGGRKQSPDQPSPGPRGQGPTKHHRPTQSKSLTEDINHKMLQDVDFYVQLLIMIRVLIL